MVVNFSLRKSEEYWAGGDLPVTAFDRMKWKTQNKNESKNELEDCKPETNKCLIIQPGDLKTVVLTGKLQQLET